MNITIQKSRPLRVNSLILATVSLLTLAVAIAALIAKDDEAVHDQAIVGLVMSLLTLPLAALTFVAGYGFIRVDGNTMSEHRGNKVLWKINLGDITGISMWPLGPPKSARAKRLYYAMDGDRNAPKKRAEIERAVERIDIPGSIWLMLRDGDRVRLMGEVYTFTDKLKLEPVLSGLLNRADIELDSPASVRKIINMHWFRIDPATQKPVSAAPVTLLGKLWYHILAYQSGLAVMALLLLIWPVLMLRAWLG